MKKLFLLTHGPGEAWIKGTERTDQPGWPEHADFMNGLADRGFVVLGGPIGETEALLVIDAPDENRIREVFAADPWHINHVLEIKALKAWTILLEHGVEHKA